MGFLPPKAHRAKTGEVFLVRSAHPTDAAQLLTYMQTVMRESPFFLVLPDEFEMSEEAERRWIEEHWDDPGRILLVTEAAESIVGSLSLQNGPYRRLAHRGILGMSVRDDWRGRGVGTALLETMLEWAQASPVIEKVALAVFATNESAMRLYRKMGFAEEGRRPREVKLGSGEYVDDILMYRFVGGPGRSGPAK